MSSRRRGVNHKDTGFFFFFFVFVLVALVSYPPLFSSFAQDFRMTRVRRRSCRRCSCPHVRLSARARAVS